MVETSVSEFRAVVQSLTGRKRSRSSASGGQHEEMNLYSDNHHYSPPVSKVPKLADGLQTLNDGKTSESAVIDDNATASNCWSDKDLGDVRIFEELELVQPIQIPDYISSKYQVFEALESIGDSTLDKFWPSIAFSEFDSL